MAAAGYKRNIFCPVPINCQFTARSIQHISGRLRTQQALVQMLAEGCAELLQKKNAIEPKPGTKIEYPRVSVPIC